MNILKLFSISMLFILVSCQDKNSEKSEENIPQESTGADTIATFDGGIITKPELNDYLLSLPANNRWNANETDQWIKELIKKRIIEKKLLKEASESNVEKRLLYQYEKHSLTRFLFTQQYISKFSDVFSINEQDLLNYYNENIDNYRVNEERMVYHIYKANLDDQSKALNEINAIKDRITQGENFKLLAKNNSDSESRHLQGLIGKIKKGVMTPDFDKVVFSLNTNTPSEIIPTTDGYHIFYVDNILKSKNLDYREVKSIIQNDLFQKTKLDYLKNKASELIDLNTIIIPKSETELLEQIDNNKTSDIIVHIGNFKLGSTQIKFSLNELKKSAPSTKVKEIAYSWVLEVAYREIIYQHMLENNLEYDQPKLLEAQLAQLLIKEYSKTKIFDYVNQHPELINEYYLKNSKRFSTPIRFSFDKLSIPKTDNNNIMNELEKSVPLLNNGEIDLTSLANKYNGSISEIKSKTYNQLSVDDYHLNNFASELEINQHSHPYTTRTAYHMIKLSQRFEPTVQPLSLIRDRVIKKYVEINETEIFSNVLLELEKSILINKKNLDSFINEYKSQI